VITRSNRNRLATFYRYKCKKNFQFKTVCNSDTAYITQLKQQNKKGIIGPFHADVSVCAWTSCQPFVITSKEKGVVAELLDTVAKHRFVQKISVLSY